MEDGTVVKHSIEKDEGHKAVFAGILLTLKSTEKLWMIFWSVLSQEKTFFKAAQKARFASCCWCRWTLVGDKHLNSGIFHQTSSICKFNGG